MSNYDIVTRYKEFMKERKENMMNPEHIVARYRMAKESDRKQRIIDLADENHCNVQKIKDILLANGVSEDELPQKGRPKKEKLVIDPKNPPLPAGAFITDEFPPTEEKIIDSQEQGVIGEEVTLMKMSLLIQMLLSLDEEAKQLKDEIKKKQDRLDAVNNAYIALKELQTIKKEVQ